MNAKNIFLLFLCLTVVNPGASAQSSNLELTFLETGYADAIFIQEPGGKNTLLDSGDVKKPDLVADFLKTKGISHLHLVILSHPHKNHFGAFFKVLDEVTVDEIIWNGDPKQEPPFQELLAKIKAKNISLRTLKRGDELEISSDLKFKVFHPGKNFGSDLNNNSLVLRMEYGKTSMLFTTDIGYAVQNELIKKFGRKLRADIVQIPHHGGPMSEKFMDFFKPQYFVLSTGPNEYALPREDQLQKLKSPVLRTDRQGDIHLISDAKKWRLSE